ncbi:MAG: hypothetical protein ACJAS4_000398 [Bacteriovoracaceae bacterium]|jgi:hypothetical protein
MVENKVLSRKLLSLLDVSSILSVIVGILVVFGNIYNVFPLIQIFNLFIPVSLISGISFILLGFGVMVRNDYVNISRFLTFSVIGIQLINLLFFCFGKIDLSLLLIENMGFEIIPAKRNTGIMFLFLNFSALSLIGKIDTLRKKIVFFVISFFNVYIILNGCFLYFSDPIQGGLLKQLYLSLHAILIFTAFQVSYALEVETYKELKNLRTYVLVLGIVTAVVIGVQIRLSLEKNVNKTKDTISTLIVEQFKANLKLRVIQSLNWVIAHEKKDLIKQSSINTASVECFEKKYVREHFLGGELCSKENIKYEYDLKEYKFLEIQDLEVVSIYEEDSELKALLNFEIFGQTGVNRMILNLSDILTSLESQWTEFKMEVGTQKGYTEDHNSVFNKIILNSEYYLQLKSENDLTENLKTSLPEVVLFLILLLNLIIYSFLSYFQKMQSAFELNFKSIQNRNNELANREHEISTKDQRVQNLLNKYIDSDEPMVKAKIITELKSISNNSGEKK